MKVFSCIFLLSLSLFACANIFAEENRITVDSKIRYISSSDVETADGDISVVKAHIGIKGQWDITPDVLIKAAIGANHYVIDSDVPVVIPDAFKSRGFHLSTELPFSFFDNDSYLLGLGVNPSFQTARGIDFDPSGFRMRGHAYLGYKGVENLLIKTGATYRAEYQQDVFPYIGLNYKFNEKLSESIDSSESDITSRLNYTLFLKKIIFSGKRLMNRMSLKSSKAPMKAESLDTKTSLQE